MPDTLFPKWALFGAAGLLPGAGPAARAQGRPDTASFVVHNPKLQNVGGAAMLRQHRLVLVSVLSPSREQTVVEQYWHDEALHLRRRVQLPLRGRLELASVQGTAHHLLVQLLSRDSLVLATVDTTGRLVAQVRQPLAARRKLYEINDLPLPQADGFVTAEQQTKEGTCRLVCRSASLAVRWEQTFGPHVTVVNAVADSTHLWALLMSDPDTRHPVSTAVCLRLADGQELGRVALTSEQARRVPSTIEMGPGHSLLVAGHAFEGQAAVLRRSGDLFFQRLSPTGQVLADYLTDFDREPGLHGAAAELVQWQLLWLARGRPRLVGETYTSTSAGHQIAASSLTLGIAGSSTVLHAKDLVSVELSPAGQVEQVRVVPLPLDESTYSYPNYRPGRVMAQLATTAGAFRTRGLAPDSTTLVLRSPARIQTLDLRTGQLRLVQPAADKGLTDVLYVGSSFVLLAEFRSARASSMRVRRVPLSK